MQPEVAIAAARSAFHEQADMKRTLRWMEWFSGDKVLINHVSLPNPVQRCWPPEVAPSVDELLESWETRRTRRGSGERIKAYVSVLDWVIDIVDRLYNQSISVTDWSGG